MHGKSSRVPDACGVDCESGKGRSFVLNVFKRRSSIGKKKKEKRGKKKMLDEAESAICGVMNARRGAGKIGIGHFYLMPLRIKFFFFPSPELEGFLFLSTSNVWRENENKNKRSKGICAFPFKRIEGGEIKRIDKVSGHPRPITGYIYLPQGPDREVSSYPTEFSVLGNRRVSPTDKDQFHSYITEKSKPGLVELESSRELSRADSYKVVM